MSDRPWFRVMGYYKPLIYPISIEGWLICIVWAALLYGAVRFFHNATTVIGAISAVCIPIVLFFLIAFYVMKNKTERRPESARYKDVPVRWLTVLGLMMLLFGWVLYAIIKTK